MQKKCDLRDFRGLWFMVTDRGQVVGAKLAWVFQKFWSGSSTDLMGFSHIYTG